MCTSQYCVVTAAEPITGVEKVLSLDERSLILSRLGIRVIGHSSCL